MGGWVGGFAYRSDELDTAVGELGAFVLVPPLPILLGFGMGGWVGGLRFIDTAITSLSFCSFRWGGWVGVWVGKRDVLGRGGGSRRRGRRSSSRTRCSASAGPRRARRRKG